MKKTIILVLTLLLSFVFFACGDKNDNEVKTVDISEIENSLLNDINYDVTLEKVSDSKAKITFNMADALSVVYYKSTDGTKADCFGIIEAGENVDIEDVVSSYNQFVSDMYDDFEKYIPEEAKKIKDTAVYMYNDDYLAFVISSDNEAKNILSKFF